MRNHSYFETLFYLIANAEEFRNLEKIFLLHGARK